MKRMNSVNSNQDSDYLTLNIVKLKSALILTIVIIVGLIFQYLHGMGLLTNKTLDYIVFLLSKVLFAISASMFIALFVTAKLSAAQNKRAEIDLESTRENLYKDIFLTLFKRIIPDTIFETVKSDIILSSVCRNDFKMRYEFTENPDGTIQLDERTEYNLQNIKIDDLDFPIELPDNNEDFKLIRAECEINDRIICYDSLKTKLSSDVIIQKGTPNKVIIKAHIPPQSCARIVSTYSKVYNRYQIRQITREYFFNYPTIKASIEIIYPKTYDLEISHWLKSLLKEQEVTENIQIRRSFDFIKAVLPNVGFIFSIKKKDEPIQNMEALGIITDNMIHNFNNQIHIIINYLDLTYRCLTDESKMESKKYFDSINKYLGRFKGTLSTLKNFSDSSKSGATPLKLSLAVNDAIRISLAKSSVKIIRKFEGTNDTIMSNAIQIRFMIISLLEKLTELIGVNNIVLGLELKNMEMKSINWILLIISRKASTLNEKLCREIFNELKFNERTSNSKIDLVSIKEEVEKWHGIMEFSFKNNNEPTFKLYFPIIENEIQSEIFDIGEKKTVGKNEKILFVDDDPEVSDVTKNALEQAGYKVDRFISSEMALEKFKKDYNEYDLVITDMNMPNLSGIALGIQIKNIRPDIPIVISTGGDERIDQNKIKDLNFQKFISKPYSSNEISREISKIFELKASPKEQI